MANLEQLKIVKQGVVAWNKWRAENPGIIPDLGRAYPIETGIGQTNLRGVDFHGADLRGAQFIDADLRWTRLEGGDLTGADLRWAHLERVNLRGADLGGANLTGANLGGANLGGANLRGAGLGDSNLRGANLSNSDFTLVLLVSTVFGENDLSTVKGLETVRHDGPSTIGIDTIYKSKGNIPEVFLRGAGVPEDFPIRLDDAVMETDQAWAASLRRTRHIGDFRAWKDHDPYQKSFERLLRDLKA